jgi:putative transcriptional regulator
MSYHPDEQTLKRFAIGEIDSAHGAAVATHLETCSHCRQLVAKFEEEAADDLVAFGTEGALSDNDLALVFNNMMNDIMELDADYSKPKARTAAKIEVNGKSFKVPAPLSPFVDQMGEWKSYGGKVFTSNIALDEDCKVSLLYITEGVQVPQHTHKGYESTLVLHGSFSDENGEYHEGDFIREDGETKHAPQTAANQDCLCLSILTEPMIFTQGVARVFNRFGKGMYP